MGASCAQAGLEISAEKASANAIGRMGGHRAGSMAGVDCMAQARSRNHRKKLSADEPALYERMQRLGERHGQHQPDRLCENEPAKGAPYDPSAFASGFRLSTEFVAG